jgi:hypothetical protein
LTKVLPYMGVASASSGPLQDYSSSVSYSSGLLAQSCNQPVQAASSERPTSTRPIEQRPQTAKSSNRADILIVKIANAVTRAVDDVQNTFKAIMEEPSKKKKQTSLAVPHWNELPSAGGFKNSHLRDPHGFQRRTTVAEKKQQQREYAYYVGWAESSGLSEETFRKSLLGAGNVRRHPKCSVLKDAVQSCREEASIMAAAAAARNLGGDDLADAAVATMKLLLKAPQHTLDSEIEAIPNSWLGNNQNVSWWKGLLGVHKLFELWLRDQGAALMGPLAQAEWEQWRHGEYQYPSPTTGNGGQDKVVSREL